ncbi:alpha/beta fold hydrolase [Actinoplanes sp. DH11]|uniref:alpha/beta fold hydrolase n=1 Tax=Actinoplanes sp. DH11 TaxID=2857011 RepID=UPI001E4F39A6|nr:alpha/beta fold hydrolase [Actinoplanes sp. DH11]
MTETILPVNGIQLCVETFGEATDDPLLLLAGDASSMDWWDDEFCRRLAAGGRFVVRYDHRDTGRSTCFPIGSPAYTGLDLRDDALGVLDVLGLPAAHLVGFSLGGGIAQRMAVDHPERVLSLTLISTSAGSGDADPPPPLIDRPAPVRQQVKATTSSSGEARPSDTARGEAERPRAASREAPASVPRDARASVPRDARASLPRDASASVPREAPTSVAREAPASAPDRATGSAGVDAWSTGSPGVAVRTVPELDWSDRRTAVARLITEIRAQGGPFTAAEPHLRRLAERIFDRTADLATGRRNHRTAGYGPPIRERLGSITAPTVVLHGTLDQRFPAEHPKELAATIPGARLVWLDGVGHELPPRAVWDTVLGEILRTHA